MLTSPVSPADAGARRPVDQYETSSVARALVSSIGRVVRGHDAAVTMVVAAVLSGGHVLIEDVPGSGKTTLARALARSLGGQFARIQGTPDLMPSDITGSGIWNPERHAFDFVPGPLFANVVLVDELNRTPPRTQSGFLEAMEELGATIDGLRYDLPEPFTLIATQNPLDQHGTYPLPEGQLDRFTVALSLGPLSADDERLVVREQLAHATVDDVVPVVDAAQLVAVRAQVRQVHIAADVLDYMLTLIQVTLIRSPGDARREHPRGALAGPAHPGGRAAERPQLRAPRRRQGRCCAVPRAPSRAHAELVNQRRSCRT